MSAENKEKELKKELCRMAITKKLNFLIGSGASYPAIPLMNEVKGNDKDEKNKNLLNIIINKSDIILNIVDTDISESDSEEIKKVKENLKVYSNFIESIIDVLNLSNSRQAPKSANIFTTNYDLFIEKSIDLQPLTSKFIFNDGCRGYFNRFLESSKYNQVVSYKGIMDNYTSQIPGLSLIKPHGSVN